MGASREFIFAEPPSGQACSAFNLNG